MQLAARSAGKRRLQSVRVTATFRRLATMTARVRDDARLAAVMKGECPQQAPALFHRLGVDDR